MKSLYLHYKNKYPGGQVHSTESSLDVYSASGEHVIAMRRDGSGSMIDQSEAFGLRDRHDLAPIPKEARVHKMLKNESGKDVVGFSEESEERKKSAMSFLCPDKKDVILSCDVLSKKHGFKFDDKQREQK